MPGCPTSRIRVNMPALMRLFFGRHSWLPLMTGHPFWEATFDQHLGWLLVRGFTVWVNKMLVPLCDIELWHHPWLWSWNFENARAQPEKITCPFRHVTPHLYVPGNKIYMPRACGHPLIPRVDWHGMKRMWVDKMLVPLCDLEIWSFWICSCISGADDLFDLKTKGI